jgi:hypothetical protein
VCPDNLRQAWPQPSLVLSQRELDFEHLAKTREVIQYDSLVLKRSHFVAYTLHGQQLFPLDNHICTESHVTAGESLEMIHQ